MCEEGIISNNEKYLAYNHDNILHIYDIKLSKLC